jgi:long-chain fatty acid transport protein
MSRPRNKSVAVWRCVVVVSALISGGTTQTTLAGGFSDPFQSPGAASVSNAGETAIAEDAATIFYNPAGMTLLGRPEAVLASAIVVPSSRFSNGGTVDALGNPMRGSVGTNPQPFSPPSLFATAPITDRLSIGLGVFIPFGQSTKYEDNWVGRYQVQTVSLKTIDIDPAIAYRLTDWVSLGGGVDIQYAHLVRDNALDFGSLCFLVIGPGTCSGIGLAPQHADGRLVADVQDWSVGYNLGILFQPTNQTRVGVSYRSAVTHSLSGVARFNVPLAAQPLTVGGKLFQDIGARSSITFPDIIGLGVSQQIDQRCTILLDIDWTLWSKIKQLTLNFDNPLQPALAQPLYWHDSVRIAVGGLYHLTDDLELRGGVAFDQSPISDRFRTADVPGADQVALSAGLAYRVTQSLKATMSYTRQEWKAASLRVTVPTAGTLVGTIHQHSDAFGFQARLQF